MAAREHRYTTNLVWTGNTGSGTSRYDAFERSHEYRPDGKPALPGSSDPAFRGDPARYSPEDLLLASLASCHMLWYLHFCSVNGIVVTAYVDKAEGVMAENADGSGEFTRVILRPEVTVRSGDLEKARLLHADVPAKCFIARSVNFPVHHEPVMKQETI